MQGSGHQRARGSGRLERAQVCLVAHAAARVNRHFGEGRCELCHGGQRWARTGARTGQVDHKQLAHSQHTRQGRGCYRARLGEIGREISRPSRRSTLSTNGGADMANKRPGSAPGPIHCVPTTLRATPTRASVAAL